MEKEEISCSTPHEENMELSQETFDTQSLTWRIPHFHELPLDVNYKVDSEQLVFEITGWRIRTYPNGMSDYDSEGSICLMMRRTSTLAPPQDVLCEFGIKDNNGRENIMAERILKKSDLELGPIKLLPLSEACKSENNFLQDGTITMVCRMKYVEEAQTDETESHEISPNMRHWKPMGHLSRGPAFVQMFTWKLANFNELPMTVDYCVLSPTFQFDDTTCYMRLYPNGRSGYRTEGSICIELEMSDFLARKYQAGFSIAIKGCENKNMEKRFLTPDEKVVGPLKFSHRSDVNKSNLDGDGIAIICKIFKVLEAVELGASNETEVSE